MTWWSRAFWFYSLVAQRPQTGEILGFSGHHVTLEVKAGRLTADRTTLAPRSRLRVTVASIEAYLAARAARANQPTPAPTPTPTREV